MSTPKVKSSLQVLTHTIILSVRHWTSLTNTRFFFIFFVCPICVLYHVFSLLNIDSSFSYFFRPPPLFSLKVSSGAVSVSPTILTIQTKEKTTSNQLNNFTIYEGKMTACSSGLYFFFFFFFFSSSSSSSISSSSFPFSPPSPLSP